MDSKFGKLQFFLIIADLEYELPYPQLEVSGSNPLTSSKKEVILR